MWNAHTVNSFSLSPKKPVNICPGTLLIQQLFTNKCHRCVHGSVHCARFALTRVSIWHTSSNLDRGLPFGATFPDFQSFWPIQHTAGFTACCAPSAKSVLAYTACCGNIFGLIYFLILFLSVLQVLDNVSSLPCGVFGMSQCGETIRRGAVNTGGPVSHHP
jgi:hypothetical protein